MEKGAREAIIQASPQFKQSDLRVFQPYSLMKTFVSDDFQRTFGIIISSIGSSFLP